MNWKHWTLVLLVLAVAQGCVIAPAPPYRQGPPNHAPAYGYRQQYRYYYYPDISVYFDLDRRLYFYLDGGWRSAVRLPRDLRARLYGPVRMDIDSAQPYSRYEEHRHQYPPGRSGKDRRWK